MPIRTPCVRCHRVGFVRVEHVIRADTANKAYYCGLCEHSWSIPADAEDDKHDDADHETEDTRSKR
jgi:hypothetical protein